MRKRESRFDDVHVAVGDHDFVTDSYAIAS